MSKIPNGKMTIGGTELRHEGGELNDSPEWAKTTDTGSDVDASNVPYRDEEVVEHALTFRCTAVWDSAQNPLAAPLSVIPGTQLANVNIYVGKTDAYYGLPLANVKRFTMRWAAAGQVGYDVELASHGTWTRPTT